jgi:putative colanic acid biosynthesis glycosyltransferase
MKVLQINTTVNTTSTGRISEEIGQNLMNNGHESVIAYRKAGPAGSQSDLVKIGNTFDMYLHGAKSRLFDLHGFGSKRPTRELIREMEKINPDVIGLHNVHGYYLNIEILFNYLKRVQKPVVWTFHDCWPFTGHCAYFDAVNCEKWKTECNDCPLTNAYPSSWFIDNSKNNFNKKKSLFQGLDNLTIVTPSRWLKTLVKQSFLKDYPVKVINNGIDLERFKPVDTSAIKDKFSLNGYKIALGVASVWDRRKGLDHFIQLSKVLGKDVRIVLVGLNKKQIESLPKNITGIERTESVEELAALYSCADIFVNPTLVDNFPTTNLEALACGTPVITYDTGGSPEAVDENTGIVVEKGDVEKLAASVIKMLGDGNENYKGYCRNRAVQKYNKKERYQDYLKLYENVLSEHHSFQPNP